MGDMVRPKFLVHCVRSRVDIRRRYGVVGAFRTSVTAQAIVCDTTSDRAVLDMHLQPLWVTLKELATRELIL